MLTTSFLTIGYPRQVLASNLNLKLRSGEMVCLIGPNGAGKSTLLRTLAGMLSPLAGEVLLDGQNLHRLPPLELAKRLAIVLTTRVEAGNLSAWTLVSLGRHPYTDWLGRLTARDQAAIRHAMELTGCLSLAERPIHELSDGERQKVMIARALAQEPKVLLLDEPTAFLDLPRRVELFQLLRRLSRETGVAILLSTHDLDLALRLADRMWLFAMNGDLLTGLPEELALSGALERVFATEGVYFDHAIGAFRVHQPVRGPVSLHTDSEGVVAAWTWRALERLGFAVQNGDVRLHLHVEVLTGGRWRLFSSEGESEHTSLESLLAALSEF
ncbi:MAG: ABC transporter ATP-binding protein [Anaerolineales bacterium]|nr:ABC transporter ATP-binding protein [Anaerolineales bacterium]MDW8227169.1 ABC transporter ATP-binding protein [Anaerolineales bacterium]